MVCASAAFAQTPPPNTAVQQQQLYQRRPDASTSPTGEQLFGPLPSPDSEDAPANVDVGQQWLLRPNAPTQPFTASASMSLFYTSNVALAPTAERGDAFGVAEAGLGYVRPLAPNLSFGANVQQSFFRYDRYSEFDFESSNANAGLTYQARSLADLLLTVQYSLNRITAGSLDDQLYLGNTVALVAAKAIRINNADSIDLAGAAGYTFADPDNLERAELRLSIGYTLRLVPGLTANAAVRTELYAYEDDREDLLQSAALALRWDITRWLAASASVSAANNSSDHEVFDYAVINGGGVLALQLRF